jgi:hypothetical protein
MNFYLARLQINHDDRSIHLQPFTDRLFTARIGFFSFAAVNTLNSAWLLSSEATEKTSKGPAKSRTSASSKMKMAMFFFHGLSKQ